MAVAAAALVLPSCALFSSSKPEPCEAVPLVLVVTGGEMQNLNPDGQAMPVEMRAFVLADRAAFDQLDYETMYSRGKEVLGGSVLGDASFTVFPKEEKVVQLAAAPKAEFLALLAFFRAPEGDRWKQVADIRPVVARCVPGELHTQVKATLFDNRLSAPERVE